MWELYAVWTWIPAYLAASLAANGTTTSTEWASLIAFGTIAIGGVGAVLAGLAADRLGRTTITSASMVASASACLAAGVLFGAPVALLTPFVLVWGFVVVADSVQFFACVTKLAEESYVGTALTIQTAIGFSVTTVSIQLVPVAAAAVG